MSSFFGGSVSLFTEEELSLLYQHYFSTFWERVDVRGEDECWPWKGSRRPTGHGQFSIYLVRQGTKHSVGAHVLAFNFFYPGLLCDETPIVMHSCHNPPCCNPFHLVAGTLSQNQVDRRKLEKVGYYRRTRM